jgi:hypothetical protein
MSALAYFSDTYVGARERFRAAVRAAGADLEVYENPTRGPAGERLTTDAAFLGARDPERLFVVVAGTHGVEGFCGSGVLVGGLANGLADDLPADSGALLIHALNPYGFAWLRRVNEENVDVNRNFIDRSRPRPANPGYDELKDAICPREWSEAALDAAQRAITDYARRHGETAFVRTIMAGQYDHPDGLLYGGRESAWSARLLVNLLRRHGARVRHVAYIDVHTGLGPYGYGEIMSSHPAGSPGHRRLLDWFGNEVTCEEAGTSSAPLQDGETVAGVAAALPHADITGITLEFGTVDKYEVFDALRGDNWLHVHGDLGSPLGHAIKARIRRAFYPDGDDWKRLVWQRSIEVKRRALRGLAAA